MPDIGYSNANVSIVDKVIGTAPWGASTIAGSKRERSVLPEELEVAEHQGKVCLQKRP